jgi:hypothetical protein
MIENFKILKIMAYMKMKFITAMLLVTANSYLMSVLKITSQKKLAACAFAKRQWLILFR